MKIERVRVHNYRSIIDAEVRVDDYLLLVGANNAGKSTFLNAIRLFYGDLKWDERDFPLKGSLDEEVWIEIDFELNHEEWGRLPPQYQTNDQKKLTLRRFFRLPADSIRKVKPKGDNIYAVDDGKVAEDSFFGAKGVATGKLGHVVYIPAVTTASEQMKLTGPSPFRELMRIVLGQYVFPTPEYKSVKAAIKALNKAGSGSSGFFSVFTTQMNSRLQPDWGVSMELAITPPSEDDVMKTMLAPAFKDQALNNAEVEFGRFGQGMQRSVLNALIELLASFQTNSVKRPVQEDETEPSEEKSDFSADLLLILYEEPEAFLHPSQQILLASKLHEIGRQPNRQVIATSHSSVFASRKVEELHQMARFERNDGHCSVHQVRSGELLRELEKVKTEFEKRVVVGGHASGSPTQQQNRDKFFFSLWLDAERAGIFFANKVFLVEGPTEKVLFDYLLSDAWAGQLKELGNFAILDCSGKYNIPRFMPLMRAFGIKFGVMIDDDNNSVSKRPGGISHLELNRMISEMCARDDFRDTSCATPVMLPDCLETFLGLNVPAADRFKPSEMLAALQDPVVCGTLQLDELKAKFREAMGLPPAAP